MIIDCHTHRYPTSLIASPDSWARSHNESHWQSLCCGADSIQDWASRERMLSDMDAAGVNLSLLLAWYWENPETCLLQNEWHAQWLKEDPSRFRAFMALHPKMGERIIDEVKRRHDQGFIGIGELHIGLQSIGMHCDTCLRVFDYAQEHGLIINFHVTEAIGRDHAARIPTTFSFFEELTKDFPNLKIVLAHWGGLLAYYELNPFVKKQFSNVYYDAAASPLLYNPKIFRSIVDAVGVNKLLFGSDYPLRLYPRKQRKAEMQTYIDAIKATDLSPSELNAFFYGNAQRLFSI